MNFSDSQIAELLDGIFDGSITQYELPEDLYFAIADYLKSGLYKGFGGTLADFKVDSKDYELLSELRENIYMFSGAKTYQQVREMVDLLSDSDGNIRSRNEFKTEARTIYDQYNDAWLDTEYNTAIGQAESAIKWNEIEKNKKVLPYLKYSAIEDENTSEICAPLDGTCLPVDAPFWSQYMPLNHFNCRCVVEQLPEEEANVTDPETVSEREEKSCEKMQDIFKMNPGKDKIIFSDEHPYYDVEKGDEGFAKENFNLPIPTND